MPPQPPNPQPPNGEDHGDGRDWNTEIPDELKMDDQPVAPYVEPSGSEERANRARQAKAWSIALDPVYGLIGMGLIGFGIDFLAGTGLRWALILGLTGLLVGFYRFIREALDLNKEQSQSSARTDGDPET